MEDFNDFMEDEDFNFDDFMEESNREFEKNLKDYQERMMIMAIEDNYANIERNGISEWHLRHMDSMALYDLKQTFKMMISHYEALEEYEKCARLVKEQTKVNDLLKVKQDI